MPRLLEAEEDAFPGFAQDPVLLSPMVDEGNAWVYGSRSKPWVAYALLLPSASDRSRVQLFSFAVHSSQRGQGFGSASLEALIGLVEELGFAQFQLYCDPGNTPGIRLYEGAGFTRGDLLPDFLGPGKDRYRYRLKLPRGDDSE